MLNLMRVRMSMSNVGRLASGMVNLRRGEIPMAGWGQGSGHGEEELGLRVHL